MFTDIALCMLMSVYIYSFENHNSRSVRLFIFLFLKESFANIWLLTKVFYKWSISKLESTIKMNDKQAYKE